MMDSINPQPPPQSGVGEPIHTLVIKDMEERAEVGKTKYGTYLYAHNKRNPLIDLYQELLDASHYALQAVKEGVDCNTEYEVIMGLCVAVGGKIYGTIDD